ncbi:hypothetical protein D9M70_603700 [compost metagenome]
MQEKSGEDVSLFHGFEHDVGDRSVFLLGRGVVLADPFDPDHLGLQLQYSRSKSNTQREMNIPVVDVIECSVLRARIQEGKSVHGQISWAIDLACRSLFMRESSILRPSS